MKFEFSFAQNYLQSVGLEIDLATYQHNQTKKVIVGMSGGVDSAVSLLLLKLQGYDVRGIFMKNWDETDENGVCTTEVDYQDVVKVCEQLDVPYYTFNFVEEYRNNVFQNFLDEYQSGHTPNPDILCNREIKFKVFFEKAMLLGADYLATGHYAQITRASLGSFLSRAIDQSKDQTYFLYAIKSQALDKVLFPVGGIQKKLVRKIADDFNLANSKKKDSTGICFIGERNFKVFLSKYITSQKGNFVDLHGKVLGKHDGVCFYTIGQRKGLGIGGPGEAWFVVKKNIEKNEVVLAQGEFHPALYSHGLSANTISLINDNFEIKYPFKCTAKIRYRAQDVPCTVNKVGDSWEIEFDEPQRAITIRQSVVLYSENICIGGAIIDRVYPSLYDLGRVDAFLPQSPDSLQALQT